MSVLWVNGVGWTLYVLNLCSRLAAKRDVIVDVEEVEPCCDIFPFCCSRSGRLFVDEFPAFIVRWSSSFTEAGPLSDLPFLALVPRVRDDPGQGFAIADAFGDFCFECCRIDSREFKESLVERAIVVIVAVASGNLRAALVQKTGQDDVAAKADTGTSRGALSQID
jgi:hypothetical protein